MKVINRMATGTNIQFYRKIKGLTLQELSDKIGKSINIVCKYEAGLLPTKWVDVICDISDALDVPFTDLVAYYPDRNIKRDASVHPCAYGRRNVNNCVVCFARTLPGKPGSTCRHVKEPERCSLFMPKPALTHENGREG